MAEIINKKAPTSEPFKVGKDPKIKVKAKRPVLLGHHEEPFAPIRVDKDEIGFVEEDEYKRHAHILEKVLLLIALLSLLLLPSRAQAQAYSANQTLATNSPLYSTNMNVATGTIAGGAMATNAVPASTKVYTLLQSPVGLTRYDSCSIMLTWNPLAGAVTGGTLTIYPCDDGVNVDTNDPIASIALPATAAGATNGLLITNLSSVALGSSGYIGAGLNNTSTNAETNLLLQVFVKPQKNG